MRILILGGTSYIGPHQVRYALARGHTVTLFNRGRTNPHLFPRVEKLVGDRADATLDALRGREWDAVIDNSAHFPRWVRQAGELLVGSVKRYLFTSSTGVYYPYHTVGVDESGPLTTIDDPDKEEIRGSRDFGGLKVLCEREAQRIFAETALIIRPQYIVGPGDGTDRFTYWPVRIDQGGEVMAPGDPADPVQYIDVRDVTEWMIRMLEQGDSGVYNAVGPSSLLTNAEFLYGVRSTTSANVSFTWVDTDFLMERDVAAIVPWFAPRGENLAMAQINGKRAIGKGLTFRPLAVTTRDTLDWFKSLPQRAPAASLAAAVCARVEDSR
jgi:2'-hydroxyisoflavone reductase